MKRARNLSEHQASAPQVHVRSQPMRGRQAEKEHLPWGLIFILSIAFHVLVLLIPIRWAPGQYSLMGNNPQRSIISFDIPGDSADPSSSGPGQEESPAAVVPAAAPEPERPRSRGAASERARDQVTTVEEADEAMEVEPEPEAASEESERPTSDAPDTETEVPDPTRLANELFVQSLIERPRSGGGAGGSEGTGGGGGGGGICDDPYLGRWRAHRYEAFSHRHITFTINVTSNQGGLLQGTIVNRSWTGSRSQTSPPMCAPGIVDDTTTMPARGFVEGDRFQFRGLRHQRRANCAPSLSTYYLDRFEGQRQGDVLRVMNNDGGADINQPYTFHRVDCR